MDNGYLVSVVIPAYQSGSIIERSLASVLSQQTQVKYEVIVVNSSHDSTPEIIRKKFGGVRLFQLEKRTPAGRARNIGAGEAKGKFIAFLDSDCIVEPHWLDRLTTHFSDDYCAIGGPIENANPERIVSRAGYILEFSEFVRRRRPCSADHIPAGNLLLSKGVFESTGGFCETYAYAQEDRLFSWHLIRKTGKKLLFHPDIRVKHYHRIRLVDYLTHQYHMGCGGAEILKFTDFRGSQLIKRKWLVNGLLPLFPLVKLSRCIYRTLKRKPREITHRPHIFFLLGLGMCFWMIGFAKRANAKRDQI